MVYKRRQSGRGGGRGGGKDEALISSVPTGVNSVGMHESNPFPSLCKIGGLS